MPPSGRLAVMVASRVAESSYSTSPVPSWGLTLACSVRPSDKVVSYSTSYATLDEPAFEVIAPRAVTPEPRTDESDSFDSEAGKSCVTSSSQSCDEPDRMFFSERPRVADTLETFISLSVYRFPNEPSASNLVPSFVVVSTLRSLPPLNLVVSAYLILSSVPVSVASLTKFLFSDRSYSADSFRSLPGISAHERAWLHVPLILSSALPV
mmetsp:Transcript_5723/g.12467  ORF Transcript_5723/g.12467 Transcript_5723/m.12467 type:complete len:209 (+) Transcript_5723:464-1090(+)